jgi:hypothetical protein
MLLWGFGAAVTLFWFRNEFDKAEISDDDNVKIKKK